MTNSQPSSVKLAGQDLRPAPYVSTSYEYEKSGSYTIGGTLNVTLDGTLVSKNIVDQIDQINNLSADNNCVELIIGCAGEPTFLQGAGRVTNVSVNTSDNGPFVANYSITVSLETVNGQSAVDPDEEFLTQYGLPADTKFLKTYSEQVTIDGDGTIIGYVDNQLSVSKSFIKASGQITICCGTKAICGFPAFNGLEQSIDILQNRFQKLLSMSFSKGHILSSYNGWNRWLDSKSITIDEDGNVSASFDMYMTLGSCQPMAHIDINTEDRISDHNITTIPNKTFSGTITGISSATTDLLSNKTKSNERLGNALYAWSSLQGLIMNGSWPGGSQELTGEEGSCEKPSCPPTEGSCYQRLSSSLIISPVAGVITVNAEFGPINSCKTNNSLIETTVEEEFPVSRYKEFIIPNNKKPVVQIFGDTPNRATITIRGSLKNCDKTKKEDLIKCVISTFDKAAGPYSGWIRTSYNINDGSYSYSITASYVKCDV